MTNFEKSLNTCDSKTFGQDKVSKNKKIKRK